MFVGSPGASRSQGRQMGGGMNDKRSATEVSGGMQPDERAAYLQRVLEGREFLLFDGAMGTMLQRAGLQAGDLPDLLNLSQPDVVAGVHSAYVDAGSQAVTTNTFGANRERLNGAASVEEVFSAAVACARQSGALFVAADIGPTGEMLEPLGDLSEEEAYDLFAEEVRAAVDAGADLIIIETMADLQEMSAAVKAAKENCDLPVFATMTFGMGGRTLFGVSPDEAARALDELEVDALGVNCSQGPAELAAIVGQMREATDKPLIAQANAGLPSVSEGETVYAVDAVSYAADVAAIVDAGATILGGCCGTDPDYIRELAKLLSQRSI